MKKFLWLITVLLMAIPIQAQDTLSGYDIALERIEAAAETGAKELDLRWLKLTEIPPEIGQLSNLRSLYLSYNQLTNVAPEIGQLSKLKYLQLSWNYLRDLPPEIGQLNKLEQLIIYDNQLQSLPVEIGQLVNLQVLILNNNELKSLPAEIGDLRNLRNLRLNINELRSLPSEIGQMKKLCALNLSYNNLEYLPNTMGDMTQLLESGDCLGWDSGLQLFDNSLISPPLEVVAQGTPAVFHYLKYQAWWHLQKSLTNVFATLGLLVLVFMGLRWHKKQQFMKRKRQ